MDGCLDCQSFLETYMPATGGKKSKSVRKLLFEALEELFTAMGIDRLMIDDQYPVSTASFISDFVKLIDEVNSSTDLVKIWHIDHNIASQIYTLFTEVISSASVDTDNLEVVSIENIDIIDEDMYSYSSSCSATDDSDSCDENCSSDANYDSGTDSSDDNSNWGEISDEN